MKNWKTAGALLIIVLLTGCAEEPAPGPVSGLSPSSGTTVSDTTPTLSWNGWDFDEFEIQISDDQTTFSTAPIIRVSDEEYTWSTPSSFQYTLYWRVRGISWEGTGPWSSTSVLHVDGTATDFSPTNGKLVMFPPTLNWEAVPGASRYDVQLSGSEAGLPDVTEVSAAGTSYTPDNPLTNNHVYYWRMRAVDDKGQRGTWSEIQSFTNIAAIKPIHVQGGIFQMGSTDSEANSDESPVHSVMVSSFYMAETELTFDQYDAYCEDTDIDKPGDEGWGRGSRPVMNVSWYDAVKYCNWLSERNNLTSVYTISDTGVTWNQSANGWRLPTEAEWEYAARGGVLSNGYKYSGSNNVDEVGWYRDNSGSKTQPVKGKKANELGLYDMSGNVWEWCWDWFDSDYYSSSPGANPTGPSSGSDRVLRGGRWVNGSRNLQVAYRYYDSPGYSNNGYGFRPVRGTITPNTATTHTVSFQENGGSSVSSQQVAQGAYATEPAAPTRSGYAFDGWYWDSGLSTAWTFESDTPVSDITLHAKWVLLVNGSLDAVFVRGGTFQMGSTDSEADSDESPVHSVTVDSFYMAETEVTHRQYLEFLNGAGVSASGQLNGIEVVDMDASYVAFSHDGTKFSFAGSSYADDIDCPVIEVTWYGAVEYSNWLSEQDGLSKAYSINGTSVTWNQSTNGYRLPTEAEWEYAARGGQLSNGYKYSGSDTTGDVGWYWKNSGDKPLDGEWDEATILANNGRTSEVGRKQANELGLYDMSGNVWEWCWDWYDSDYYSSSPASNPTGPSSSSNRVVRGGSWYYYPRNLRVANRGSGSPGSSYILGGFRLAVPAD